MFHCYLKCIKAVKYIELIAHFLSTGNHRQVRGQVQCIFLGFLSAPLMTAGTKYYLQNWTLTNI